MLLHVTLFKKYLLNTIWLYVISVYIVTIFNSYILLSFKRNLGYPYEHLV